MQHDKDQPEAETRAESKIDEAGKVQITIPDATQRFEEEQVSEVVKVSLAGELTPPSPTHAFFSGVKMIQSQRDGTPLFTLEYGRIDARTPRDFMESRLHTILAWVSKFTMFFADLPSEIEPLYKRAKVTTPSAMGFNVAEAVLSLQHDRRQRDSIPLIAAMQNEHLPADHHLKRYRKLAFVAATPDEVALQVHMDAITRRRFGEVSELHEFFHPLRDMFTTIAPLKRLDTNLEKFYRPPSMEAFHPWIDGNFRMRSLMWELMYNVVSTSIPIPVTASDSTFRELLQVLSANSTTMRAVTDYPSKLSQSAGRDMLTKWFTAKLASRYAKIWIDVPLADVSIGGIMQCLLAKLYFARSDVHPDSVLDVDNYLARWLIPALPGYDRRRDPFDFHQAEQRRRNYLSEQYAANVLGRQYGPGDQRALGDDDPLPVTVWNFLLTTEAGGGWATAGRNAVVPLPDAAAGMLNPRPYWYAPPFGESQRTRTDVPLQFQFLERVIDVLVSRPPVIASPHEHIGRSLSRLLQWIRMKRVEFAEFAWYAERAIRKYSYNALVHPEPALPARELDPITLLPDSIFSAIAYASFDAKAPLDVPFDLIHAAWRIHEDFNGFNDHFHFYAHHLTDDVYSRKDHVTMALKSAGDSTGILAYLSGKLVTEGELYSVNMPSDRFITRDFTDRVDAVSAFIDVHLDAFGVADRFFYDPNPTRHATYAIQRSLRSDSPDLAVLSYDDLQDIIGREGLAALFRQARERSRRIVFNFPVNYDVKWVDAWAEHSSPIVLPSPSTYLSISPIPVDVSFDDIVLFTDKNDQYEERDSPWIISHLPLILEDEGYIRTLFNHIEVDREPILFHTRVEFDALR